MTPGKALVAVLRDKGYYAHVCHPENRYGTIASKFTYIGVGGKFNSMIEIAGTRLNFMACGYVFDLRSDSSFKLFLETLEFCHRTRQDKYEGLGAGYCNECPAVMRELSGLRDGQADTGST